MISRARLGDVLEFRLGNGLYYAQYTHRHPILGHLCYVLQDAYHDRPSDFRGIVGRQPGYFAFTFVPSLLRDGLGGIVARAEVPEAHKRFPLFKAAAGWLRGGQKARQWWLWDGEKEWRVGELSPDQHDLPVREVVSNSLFLKRLEQHWHPRDTVAIEGVDY